MKRFGAIFTALIIAVLPLTNSYFAAFAAGQTATPIQHYTVIDLTPADARNATALGVSGTTQVGTADFPAPGNPGQSETHAMIWSGSATTAIDLGLGSAVAARDGQQTGNAFNRAALWSGTQASWIDLTPTTADMAVATGLANGQQVGWARWTVLCAEKKGACGGGSGTTVRFRALLWSGSAASMVDITPFSLGYGAGRALGTDGLQQVGYGQQVLGANAFSGPLAVVWNGTADSAVNLNPVGSSISEARAVANGQQVGYAFTPSRAMLWTGTAESGVNLHPAGFLFSLANATNGSQQAGYGLPSGSNFNHALVWSGTAASALDLHQFLPLGYLSSTATGIDAAGNIVGTATTADGMTHAIMWKPSAPAETYAQSLGLNPTTITAGGATQATVTLNQAAPAGGAVVNLGSYIPQGANPLPFSVALPASVTVPEGESSASFAVTTNLISLAGFTRSYPVSLQAAYGDTMQSVMLTVAPPLFLSTLSVTPTNVTGGANVTGTVTINGAAPAEGAQVTLSSNNAAVMVPPSVLINPGQTFATFTAQTNVVASFTNVTISATYGSVLPATQTATLVVAPPQVETDTVKIQKADYTVSKRELSVQATSTSQFAILDVYVTATGQWLGSLLNKGAGSYSGKLSVATNPQNITVVSNLTGTDTFPVTAK